jgi:heme A synthase
MTAPQLPPPLRRVSVVALAVAFLHLVFGAIVRITGSGMGCGDHWPKCHGWWIPPMNRQDLVIEVTHRYLALLLTVSVLSLLALAWRHRGAVGVGGRGGVLRAAAGAALAVVVTAGFGAVTVKFGNPRWATVVHWTLAMSVIGLLVAAAVRAGALGGASARDVARAGTGSARSARGAMVAAAIAFAAVVLGGLTAKTIDASVACPSFPLCGSNPAAAPGAAHVQLTHRILAFLLLFHYVGIVIGVRKRGERDVVARAAWIGFAAITLQILVAGAMIGMRLPPALRSLHQAVGVAIWVTSFAFAYLGRTALGVSRPAGTLDPAPRQPSARATGARGVPVAQNAALP